MSHFKAHSGKRVLGYLRGRAGRSRLERNRSARLRGRRGAAAIELAVIAPVLLMLLLGTTDIVIWFRTWMRMDQTTSQMAQIITRYNLLYTSDFSSTFYPLAQAAVGTAVLTCTGCGMAVTGIDNVSGTPAIQWAWTSGGVASAFVSGSGPSASLHLPGGYVPPTGFSAIVVELFTTQASYVFSREIMASTGLSNINTYAVAMPRAGGLPSLTVGTRP